MNKDNVCGDNDVVDVRLTLPELFLFDNTAVVLDFETTVILFICILSWKSGRVVTCWFTACLKGKTNE